MIYIDILTDMLIISDDTNYMGRATKTIAYLLFVPLTYMRVVLNSFIWKTPSSPKKILSPNFRELHVYLSRYMLAKIFKKNMDVTMCDILKLFQASDPLSHFILRPLHLNIYVLL